MIDDLARFKIDERQLVGVVTARGGQRVLAVCQRNNVQRQIGQGHMLAGRL